MSSLSDAIRRRASLALLPLSMVPFTAVAPTIVHQHERFDRVHHMGALAAPDVGLTAAETARFPVLPAVRRHIPVLLWHGIDDVRDGMSTSRRAFARQLALLEHLGYTTLTMRQWADFRAGRPVDLPAKPIVLTFDDGRLDSFRGADKVLQRYGMHAAMFVITGAIEGKDPRYLTWTELHKMADSGRWDIEPHAHEGHRAITVGPDGRQAPFYAARRYTRSAGLESLAAWEERTTADLFAVKQRLAAQGFTPHAFAVPYSNYGEGAGSDPTIGRLNRDLLTRQFGSFFVQDRRDPGFTGPGAGATERFPMRTQTTLDELYGWLRSHSMTAAAKQAAGAAQAPDDHHPTPTTR